MAAPMASNIASVTPKYLDSERRRACHSSSFEHVDVISYSDFFVNYLLPNKPCIFTPELTKSWKSRQDWVSKDGSPNFGLLKDIFGEAIVPVANCKQAEYSSHPKTEMLMSAYIDYWQKYKETGYNSDMPCLYLKDWHFIKRFPEYKAYSTPIYFQSDWLNEFWDTLPNDDYRFVYMGPKGTWTPFHADVYRSYSWSANICGKKKWIFYPPGCEENLTDRLGNLIYDVMSPDLDTSDMFPNAHKVKGQMLEVIQGQGQVIFVPSGWHHQVFNMEDTISINHNWLNACNLDICWKHLQDSLSSVKAEIDHCKDMEGWTEQCQLILKATAGIDYSQFIHMLRVICEHRLLEYHKLSNSTCGRGEGSQSNLDEFDNTGSEFGANNGDFEVKRKMFDNSENELLVDSGKCVSPSYCCDNCGTESDDSSRMFCEKCENKNLKAIGKQKCFMRNWKSCDFVLFDLKRIEEVLNNIVNDLDYKSLDKTHEHGAEYVLELLNEEFNVSECF